MSGTFFPWQGSELQLYTLEHEKGATLLGRRHLIHLEGRIWQEKSNSSTQVNRMNQKPRARSRDKPTNQRGPSYCWPDVVPALRGWWPYPRPLNSLMHRCKPSTKSHWFCTPHTQSKEEKLVVYLSWLKNLECAPNYTNQKESQSEHSIFRNAPPTLAYELTRQAGEVGVIILVLWIWRNWGRSM